MEELTANVSDLTTALFAIAKADHNDDGTMMVYGKATDDSLDIDQQICDPEWLDRVIPTWFKTSGYLPDTRTPEVWANAALAIASENGNDS